MYSLLGNDARLSYQSQEWIGDLRKLGRGRRALSDHVAKFPQITNRLLCLIAQSWACSLADCDMCQVLRTQDHSSTHGNHEAISPFSFHATTDSWIRWTSSYPILCGEKNSISYVDSTEAISHVYGTLRG